MRTQDRAAMKKWMWIGTTAIVGLLVVAFSAFEYTKNARRPHAPPDETLKALFAKNESDLGELVRMSDEDSSVIRIAPDFTWDNNGARFPLETSQLPFSQERWERYKTLFKRIGSPAGITRDDLMSGCTEITIYSSGLVTGGSEKGFVWCANEPSPLAESLDQLPKVIEQTPFIRYRKLKDHWYLYIEID